GLSASLPSWSAAADKEKAPDYYPLKVGNKWHYRVEAAGQTNKITLQISKMEKINDKEVARLETVAQGGVAAASEHVSSAADGVYRHRFNDMDVTPPLCLIKYPVKKGESWTTEISIGQQKAKAVCNVIGEEEIKVGTNKYKTVAVKIDVDLGPVKITTTYWFS